MQGIHLPFISVSTYHHIKFLQASTNGDQEPVANIIHVQPTHVVTCQCNASPKTINGKALWQDLFATTGNESEISRTTKLVWPEWTDLIIMPKGLKLTEQLIELQFVICQAMEIVEEWFIFEGSYPGLIMRNGWNQWAIQAACKKMASISPAGVKIKYQTISECSKVDPEYLKEIMTLVSH